MWVQWIWGFIIPVFYMAYMGKWIRRSGVMTGSEWMETRFGSGKAGEAARASYTIYAVLTITAFLAYGAVGMGKFGSVYLPFSEHVCAALIIGITGIYVVMGGFHGVVMVEIFQTVGAEHRGHCHRIPRIHPRLGGSVGSEGPLELGQPRPGVEAHRTGRPHVPALRGAADHLGDEGTAPLALRAGAALRLPAVPGGEEPEGRLEARGAVGSDTHRALADGDGTGSPWHNGARSSSRDHEKVLPSVIQQMLPAGLRGFAIAALLSGFLATFNSTVNGGASYIVKDIYHKYINPDASQKTLIRASYVSSALLIVMGISIGFFATSINQMFTWIMGTLGAGVLMPNVLRWYWWRMNGWGYAAGAISGMVLSLIQAFVPALSGLALFVTFPAIVLIVLVITIIVTYTTEATDEKTLAKFYTSVRPAGFWGCVSKGCKSSKPSTIKRDLGNVVIGIPCLAAMWMCPIYLVLHRFTEAIYAAAIVLVACLVLYRTWYLRLEED